jgi:hypothetical protein
MLITCRLACLPFTTFGLASTRCLLTAVPYQTLRWAMSNGTPASLEQLRSVPRGPAFTSSTSGTRRFQALLKALTHLQPPPQRHPPQLLTSGPSVHPATPPSVLLRQRTQLARLLSALNVPQPKRVQPQAILLTAPCKTASQGRIETRRQRMHAEQPQEALRPAAQTVNVYRLRQSPAQRRPRGCTPRCGL